MSSTSYWEEESFLKNIDYTVIGSGIVGLTCALELRRLNPNSKIVILERGFLPTGASTKNAGFTCFGSPSELLDDLSKSKETDVFQLVENRVKGLSKLRALVGDSNMDYKEYGSYELFDNTEFYENCISKLDYLNKQLHKIFKAKTFEVYANARDFGLDKKSLLIKNNFEGQINTGKMMKKLIHLARTAGIEILNGFDVDDFQFTNNRWEIYNTQATLKTTKLILCNNAFASKFYPEFDLKPARAQVLITKPIEGLKLKGCFHMDQGYYYFRNVGDRVLLGGGRNLDFKTEETFEMNTSEKIQKELKYLLKTKILPNQPFEIDKTWAGIMGVGSSKSTYIKQLDEGLYCAVRMGGMGIALGANVGQEIAELASETSLTF
jgi:glycine/D-amino acid oxidase-like deaminating enzyme